MFSLILWVGATDPVAADPTGGFLSLLGPFAAAVAAVGYGWWRESKRNEKLQETVDAIVPLLVESKLNQSATIVALQAATAANERLAARVDTISSALERLAHSVDSLASTVPTTDEMVRLRDMLTERRRLA